MKVMNHQNQMKNKKKAQKKRHSKKECDMQDRIIQVSTEMSKVESSANFVRSLSVIPTI